MKTDFFKTYRLTRIDNYSAGFTLIELLVAMAISTIVIGVAGFGLVTIMGTSRKAEAESLRRKDLNRALDFIADEVRMARRINDIGAGTTTSSQAVSNSGLSLGSIGTAVLYLEIPVGSCSTTQVVDKVVYDIRTTTEPEWLGPKVIYRYGRVPDNNGAIDPCSNPVSKPLIDFISATDINPSGMTPSSCTGTQAVPLTPPGFGGFNACVDGRKVNLYLVGKLTTSTSTPLITTTVFARSAP